MTLKIGDKFTTPDTPPSRYYKLRGVVDSYLVIVEITRDKERYALMPVDELVEYTILP